MKKTGIRLSAAVVSAAMAAACVRILPDTVPAGIIAGAAETEAQPLYFNCCHPKSWAAILV